LGAYGSTFTFAFVGTDPPGVSSNPMNANGYCAVVVICCASVPLIRPPAPGFPATVPIGQFHGFCASVVPNPSFAVMMLPLFHSVTAPISALFVSKFVINGPPVAGGGGGTANVTLSTLRS
jgi:hypothetical protein